MDTRYPWGFRPGVDPAIGYLDETPSNAARDVDEPAQSFNDHSNDQSAYGLGYQQLSSRPNTFHSYQYAGVAYGSNPAPAPSPPWPQPQQPAVSQYSDFNSRGIGFPQQPAVPQFSDSNLGGTPDSTPLAPRQPDALDPQHTQGLPQNHPPHQNDNPTVTRSDADAPSNPGLPQQRQKLIPLSKLKYVCKCLSRNRKDKHLAHVPRCKEE